MGNVQSILEAPSAKEIERARFEAWACSKLGPHEAKAYTYRNKAGEYHSGALRAGWAAWQARGLMDNNGCRRDV